MPAARASPYNGPLSVRVGDREGTTATTLGRFVFARRGIVPEACSSYFLPRLVGVGKALEWCTTGRTFLARDEAASGLFNHVVPADRVLPKALEIAAEIAQNTSMISVALVKELIWDSQRDGATAERAHLNDSRSMYYVGCVNAMRTPPPPARCAIAASRWRLPASPLARRVVTEVPLMQKKAS